MEARLTKASPTRQAWPTRAPGVVDARRPHPSPPASVDHDMRLTLGYSPCPNDTFIFHALTHGLLANPAGAEAPLTFAVTLADIAELNRAAAHGDFDVAKVSFHAYGY